MFTFDKLGVKLNKEFLNKCGIYFDHDITDHNKNNQNSNIWIIPYPYMNKGHNYYFWKIYKSYRKNFSIRIFENHMVRYKCKLHYYMGYLKNDICNEYDQNHYYDIDKISTIYYENIDTDKISKYLGLIMLTTIATIEAIVTLPRLLSKYQSKCDLMKVMVHISKIGHLKKLFSDSKNVLTFENIQPLRKEVKYHIRLIDYYLNVDKDLQQSLDYFKVYSNVDQFDTLSNFLRGIDVSLIKLSCPPEITIDRSTLNIVDKFIKNIE